MSHEVNRGCFETCFPGAQRRWAAAHIGSVMRALACPKDSCTDEEVERGFQMTRALGARIMTASTTLTMAKRTLPYVQKHKIFLALHGHSNLSDPNQFATPESFMEGLAMSPYYKVNLDIGHFSAAGFDS